jgi:hypothetical protein
VGYPWCRSGSLGESLVPVGIPWDHLGRSKWSLIVGFHIGVSMGVRVGSIGRPWDFLGTPWSSLGCPLGVPWDPTRSLEGHLGVS